MWRNLFIAIVTGLCNIKCYIHFFLSKDSMTNGTNLWCFIFGAPFNVYSFACISYPVFSHIWSELSAWASLWALWEREGRIRKAGDGSGGEVNIPPITYQVNLKRSVKYNWVNGAFHSSHQWQGLWCLPPRISVEGRCRVPVVLWLCMLDMQLIIVMASLQYTHAICTVHVLLVATKKVTSGCRPFHLYTLSHIYSTSIRAPLWKQWCLSGSKLSLSL